MEIFINFSFSLSELTVRVGSSLHEYGGSIIKLKRVVKHPNHDNYNLENDFSLLELAEPLKFNDRIQPIALPDADTHIADGTRCAVSGWGKFIMIKFKNESLKKNRNNFLLGNTQNWDESDEKLRVAYVPIVNQDLCHEQYREIVPITSSMICAGLEIGGKDACQGDSGGPLIDQHNGCPRLIGVVSFGVGCAQPNYSGVYARVTSARQWIRSVTGI